MFTKAFVEEAVEKAAVAAAGVFAGSQFFNAGTLTLKDLAAAGVATALAFVYTFVKQFGATQGVAGSKK